MRAGNCSMHLRELSECDVEPLGQLIARCGDYYEIATGGPPGPSEAHAIFTALPPGSTYADKSVVGIEQPAGQLVGVCEYVRGWPEQAEWIIGLLLLEPQARGRGLGRAVAHGIERRALAGGARAVRVAVVRANAAALAFWTRLGYEIGDEGAGRTVVMTRRLGPSPPAGA